MKKFISVLITITIVLGSFTVGIVANAASDVKVSGDFKYKVVDDKVVITKYIGSEKEVEVPSQIDGITVKEIGKDAFIQNSNITSVALPDTITDINDGAFLICKNLSEVNIPESLTSLGSAFCGTNITEIIIPESTTFIDSHAFSNCRSLKKLTIKSPITKIPNGLCGGCEELEEVNLPETIISVGMYAFTECKKLKSISFSDNLEEIKQNAFSDSGLEQFHIGKNVKDIRGLLGAKKLSELTLDIDNEKYTLEDGVLYNKKMTKLVFFPSALNIKKYTVPKTVKSIGKSSVYKNYYLEEVKLNKVKYIYGGNFCFTSIKKIVIPKTVEMINDSCFKFCSKLEKVIFKTKKPIYIWDICFIDCKSLKYAEYPKLKSKFCGVEMYDGCKSLKKIKVLSGVKEIPNFSGRCKALKTIIIPKSVKKITSGLGYNSKKKPVKGFTIKGKKNSAAHKYAKKNKFKFVAI